MFSIFAVLGDSILEVPVNAQNTSTSAAPVGMGLNSVVDWSGSYQFIDHAKQTRGWWIMDGNYNNRESELNLDSLGWPMTIPVEGVALRVFEKIPKTTNYVITYDGVGEVTTSTGSIVSRESGRIVVALARGGSFEVRINSSETNNYVRNLSVVMAEHEVLFNQGEKFNPDWLEFVKDFEALRFMDWMATNNSNVETFDQRKPAGYYSYSNQTTAKHPGPPIETMVHLSNKLQSEPWFNMPHMANDEYVIQFATLVKNNLTHNLNVHVEFSNEVWNGQFSQHGYIRNRGVAAGFGGSDFDKLLRWHGQRTSEICKLWEDVFADQQNRVVCVLGAQAANTYTGGLALNQAQQAHNNIDAVAIAPYFGGDLASSSRESEVQNLTLDQFFEELEFGGVISSSHPGGWLKQADDWVTAYVSDSRFADVDIVAYEGGQHLSGFGGTENNPVLTDLFIAANKDPRMGELYTKYLNNWRDAGGKLFMNFVEAGFYSKWGSWGAINNIYDPIEEGPKFTALQTFSLSNTVPCWWYGCFVLFEQNPLNEVADLSTDTLDLPKQFNFPNQPEPPNQPNSLLTPIDDQQISGFPLECKENFDCKNIPVDATLGQLKVPSQTATNIPIDTSASINVTSRQLQQEQIAEQVTTVPTTRIADSLGNRGFVYSLLAVITLAVLSMLSRSYKSNSKQ